jgi:hypothetical protein
MALTDEGMGTTMLMQPAYGAPYGNGGYGGLGLGGDGLWILLILLLGGGWGGFGGFGMGGMMGAGMLGMDMGFGLYPWLNNSQNINDGFRDQMMNTSINGIQNSINGLSTQLCQCCGDMQLGLANGFNGVNNSIFGAQTAISQQLNSNELASLNRSFAEQMANAQGFNNINAGIADLRYTEATENCATRANSTQNSQNIINAITAGIQSIKDDLCADRLEAERRENQNLRTQLSMAQLAASTVEQTAQLRASQATTANQLVAELRSCPIPSQPVYGNQPIFTCPQTVATNNCGCGCGSF